MLKGQDFARPQRNGLSGLRAKGLNTTFLVGEVNADQGKNVGNRNLAETGIYYGCQFMGKKCVKQRILL